MNESNQSRRLPRCRLFFIRFLQKPAGTTHAQGVNIIAEIQLLVEQTRDIIFTQVHLLRHQIQRQVLLVMILTILHNLT